MKSSGLWRVTASHRDAGLQGLTETRDLVVRSENGLETLDLSADLPNLNRLAKAGGLQAGTLDQTEALLKDLSDKLNRATRNDAKRFGSGAVTFR